MRHLSCDTAMHRCHIPLPLWCLPREVRARVNEEKRGRGCSRRKASCDTWFKPNLFAHRNHKLHKQLVWETQKQRYAYLSATFKLWHLKVFNFAQPIQLDVTISARCFLNSELIRYLNLIIIMCHILYGILKQILLLGGFLLTLFLHTRRNVFWKDEFL